jgi:hypothetical protein
MKATTATTTLPTSRPAFYNKKRSSPSSLTKRKDSPLRDSLRRTPPEIVSAEMQRHAAMPMALADREMQNLLELEYREDVKAYMYEMEVS